MYACNQTGSSSSFSLSVPVGHSYFWWLGSHGVPRRVKNKISGNAQRLHIGFYIMMLAVTNSKLVFCTGGQSQACYTYFNNVYRQPIFHTHSIGSGLYQGTILHLFWRFPGKWCKLMMKQKANPQHTQKTLSHWQFYSSNWILTVWYRISTVYIRYKELNNI